MHQMNDARKEELLVIGAGGHAKVVIATACSQGFRVVGILDDDQRKVDNSYGGLRVLGTTADLCHFSGMACVLAVGDNQTRHRLYGRWRWRQLRWQTLVHPSAFVDSSATIGQGTVVFAGASVQVDVVVGDHCIINTQASIDHDCRLADFVHVAPGCHLAGNVTVEEGAFLGIGSCVVPGLTIGAGAVVGAGTVVLQDVAPGTTVVGVPARELTSLRERSASQDYGRGT